MKLTDDRNNTPKHGPSDEPADEAISAAMEKVAEFQQVLAGFDTAEVAFYAGAYTAGGGGYAPADKKRLRIFLAAVSGMSLAVACRCDPSAVRAAITTAIEKFYEVNGPDEDAS